MAFNVTCTLCSCIARGNWQLARECTIFVYLTYKLHVNMSGRALAGFANTKRKVYSPNLDAIKGETSAGLSNVVKLELFGLLGIKELEQGGSLETFKDVMLGSLLEYYDDVAKDCGEDCLLLVRLKEVFSKQRVSPAMIRQWGKKIKEARAAKNVVHKAPSGDLVKRIDFYHQQNQDTNLATQVELANVKVAMQELKAENKEVS